MLSAQVVSQIFRTGSDPFSRGSRGVDFGLLMKRLLFMILALYGLLLAVHLVNTGSLSGSFRMTGTDFRVAAKCPNQPKIIFRFIGRSAIESLELGFADLLGEDVPAVVCEKGWPLPS